MPAPDEPNPIESLLAQGDWLRSVAQRLVVDPNQADDLVQDGWLSALRQPPRDRSNLRGWMAKVLQRQALQRSRSDSRRSLREQVAAKPEASLDDLAQRASLQRDLLAHVVALEEPFRSVILLRFFEDHTPPEIAERLGVPLKTVHSRLARAFHKLRERLDNEYGDRGLWFSALLPLAGLEANLPHAAGHALAAATTTKATGVWIMNEQTKLAVAAAVLTLGGLGVWRFASVERGPLHGGPLRSASTDTLATPLPTGSPPQENQVVAGVRSALGAKPGNAPPTGNASPLNLGHVEGRALDVQGRPIPNIRVAFTAEQLAAGEPTAGDGSFRLELRQDIAVANGLNSSQWPCLVVLDPGWITLRSSCVQANNQDREHLVVAAQSKHLEGWVQDGSGMDIVGAKVELDTRSGAMNDFPLPLDMTQPALLSALTKDGGHFVMETFPDVKRLRLHVTAQGYLTRSVDLDTVACPLIIHLERPKDGSQPMLEGIVVDRAGQSVEGAQVQLSSSRTQTGPGGLFRLPIPRLASATPLCAAKSGHQPALIPAFQTIIDQAGGEPGPVELVLGEPTRSIRGRVLDQAEQPCAGWIVSIVDGTEISQGRIPIDSAEALAGGSTLKVRTDPDGRFQLDGLMDRDYHVQAYEERTLLCTKAHLRAGDEAAVLRLQSTVVQRLSGQVVAKDGSPVPGATVKLSMKTNEGASGFNSIGGTETVTDDQGRFILRNVPSQFVHLDVFGESLLPSKYFPEAGFADQDQRVEVLRRCHFQLELTGLHPAADQAWFENDAGKRQQVNRFESGGMSGFPWVPLTDGKSEVLSVSEAASSLVIARGSEVLARVPVTFDPTGVTQLRE